jgi:hypothetical protein
MRKIMRLAPKPKRLQPKILLGMSLVLAFSSAAIAQTPSAPGNNTVYSSATAFSPSTAFIDASSASPSNNVCDLTLLGLSPTGTSIFADDASADVLPSTSDPTLGFYAMGETVLNSGMSRITTSLTNPTWLVSGTGANGGTGPTGTTCTTGTFYSCTKCQWVFGVLCFGNHLDVHSQQVAQDYLRVMYGFD